MSVKRDEKAQEENDLSAAYELLDIRIYEVAFRTDQGFKGDEVSSAARARRKQRKEQGRSDDEDQNWDITIKVSPKRLECRARLMIVHRDCRYLVDAASIYSRREHTAEDPPEHAVISFAESEALPTLFPYLRAEVHQAAEKVRGSRRVFSDLTMDGVRKAFDNAKSSNGQEVEPTNHEG